MKKNCIGAPDLAGYIHFSVLWWLEDKCPFTLIPLIHTNDLALFLSITAASETRLKCIYNINTLIQQHYKS